MDIVILLSLDKSAIMIYAPPTFMILGLIFENEASDCLLRLLSPTRAWPARYNYF